MKQRALSQQTLAETMSNVHAHRRKFTERADALKNAAVCKWTAIKRRVSTVVGRLYDLHSCGTRMRLHAYERGGWKGLAACFTPRSNSVHATVVSRRVSFADPPATIISTSHAYSHVSRQSRRPQTARRRVTPVSSTIDTLGYVARLKMECETGEDLFQRLWFRPELSTLNEVEVEELKLFIDEMSCCQE